MKKIFPTDKKINFLVADDVRREVSGKAIIIGYYSDGSIISSYPETPKISKNQPMVFPSFCFLWVFTDGEGDFDVTASIKYPDGTIIEVISQTMNKKRGEAQNLLVRMSPFLTHIFGEFECIVNLDDNHQYTRKFRIIHKTL